MVTHTLVASSEKRVLPSASIMIFVKSCMTCCLVSLSKRGVPTLFHNANVKPIVTSRYRRSVAQKISEWEILLRCSNERQDDCSTSYEMVWYQL